MRIANVYMRNEERLQEDCKILVQVKINGQSGYLGDFHSHPDDLMKLISNHDGEFHNLMRFDDYPLEVYRYRIDPIKNKFVIYARAVPPEREAEVHEKHAAEMAYIEENGADY